ncbi:MAG TPA: transporter [Candidatus Binatia bacterium]|nr:transporter [Candidatus Binatia bacterium]
MKPPIRSLLVLFLLGFSVLTRANISLAGRPLAVDDAAPVAPGQLEVEFGLTHGRLDGGGREQAWPAMTMAYGLVERLEIGLSIQRVNHDRRAEPALKGFEDLHLASKLTVFEETDALPAVALSLDVKIPTGSKSKGLSTGKFDEAFTFIFSKAYAPLGIHVNLGYLLVDSPRNAKLRNRLRGGIATDYALNGELILVGEVFGAARAGQEEQNEAAFQLGFRYALTKSVVFDAAAGRSLRRAGPKLQGTTGLTWTIDAANLFKARR